MSAAIASALKYWKYLRLGMNRLRDQEGKQHHGLAYAAIVVIGILLLPMTALSLPGLLGKSGNLDTYDLTQSTLYQQISTTYDKYLESYEKKAKKRAEEVKKENAYTVTKTVTDEEGNEKEETETKYPEVEVIPSFSSPLKSYVFAYIAVQHADAQTPESWKYDEKEILDFLHAVTRYEEQITKHSQSSITYQAQTIVKTPEEIAKQFFEEKEKQDMFLFSAQTFAEFDVADAGSGTGWDGTIPTGGESLGWVSRLYETGSPQGNPGSISSGKGDYGGKSYGTPQFSLSMGSIHTFVKWLKSYDATLYAPFAGVSVGSSAFDNAWKQLANTRRKEFATAQSLCVYQMHVGKWIQNAKKTSGIDFSRSYALEEMAYSRGVQHGGNGAMSVFRGAGITTGATDAEIISKFYQYLHDHVDSYWRNCSASVRAGVANRMLAEKQTLLSLVGKERPGESGEKEEKKTKNEKRTD